MDARARKYFTYKASLKNEPASKEIPPVKKKAIVEKTVVEKRVKAKAVEQEKAQTPKSPAKK
jgi:hypothetical protein